MSGLFLTGMGLVKAMTVKQLQHLLGYLGYDVEPDGVYGLQTGSAVRRFQEKFPGLKADAIAGDETQEALVRAVGENWQRPAAGAAAEFWKEIRYFHREEPFIGCSCGQCGGFPAEPAESLMKLADRVREHFDMPMIPTSTVRCRAHNGAVGGVENSRHLLGKAMDFWIPGASAEQVLSYVKRQADTRYAYIIGGGPAVHMDVN